MFLKELLRDTFVHRLYWKCKKAVYKRKLEKKVAQFHKDGLEMLKAFTKVMNAAGHDYWLDFGTLLGYYREHGFIAHDNDLDFGAYIEDAPKIRETLESHGFELVRNYRIEGEIGIEECYRYNKSTFDVFYYRKCGDTLVGCSFLSYNGIELNKEIPMRVMEFVQPNTGLKEDTFLGCNVKVPADPVAYLKANYGDNFMIPDPNYNSENSSPNITVYSYNEKKGIGFLKLEYQ